MPGNLLHLNAVLRNSKALARRHQTRNRFGQAGWSASGLDFDLQGRHPELGQEGLGSSGRADTPSRAQRKPARQAGKDADQGLAGFRRPEGLWARLQAWVQAHQVPCRAAGGRKQQQQAAASAH